MEFKEANKHNIKYILGSMLMKEGCGQVCIRKAFTEYKSKGRITYDLQIVQRFYEELKSMQVGILAEWEEEYPSQFECLTDAPVLLFYIGDIGLLQRRMISIVGTRKCSLYGLRVVEWLIRIIRIEVPEMVAVSGLAYGIDSAVHQQSLKNEVGTIAVVAGGIDKGYPRGNEGIYEGISIDGLILAEFPPGVAVIKGMFPMRNRLIAALGEKIIVVEAARKSGALLTANLGLELGKEIFAVPGDLFREVAQGSNKLISNGANVLIPSDIEFLLEESISGS